MSDKVPDPSENFAVGDRHTEIVLGICSYGSYIYTASADGLAKQWNLQGECMHTFQGECTMPPAWVRCVHATRDFLYTGCGGEGTVRQWSLDSTKNAQTGLFEPAGKTVGLLDCEGADVNAIVCDSNHCYAGGRDKDDGAGKARQFDTATGDLVRTFEGHTEAITSIGIYGSELFTGSIDMTCRKWDVNSGTCTGTFQGHTDAIFCLDVSSGTLWTGGKDETKAVKGWNIAVDAAPQIEFHDSHGDAVNALAVMSSTIFLGTGRGVVHEYNTSTGEEVRQFAHPSAYIWGMCLSGSRLFIVGRHGGDDSAHPGGSALVAEIEISGGGLGIDALTLGGTSAASMMGAISRGRCQCCFNM